MENEPKKENRVRLQDIVPPLRNFNHEENERWEQKKQEAHDKAETQTKKFNIAYLGIVFGIISLLILPVFTGIIGVCIGTYSLYNKPKDSVSVVCIIGCAVFMGIGCIIGAFLS